MRKVSVLTGAECQGEQKRLEKGFAILNEEHQIRLGHFENLKPTIWIKREGKIKNKINK